MLTVLLWLQQNGAVPIENPSPAIWLGVVGPVLALTAAIVGRISYEKGKTAGAKPSPVDAMLERQEGAFQERVGGLLRQLGDTISAGNAAHRQDLQAVTQSMNSAAHAMRLVVDEVSAHSKQTEPAIAASVAMLPLVRDLHGQIPQKRRRGRKR